MTQYRKNPENKSLKKDQKVVNNYARYSGLAFEMAIVILAGTFGGIKLDKVVRFQFPLFTVVFSFLSVLIAMYVVIKEFIGKK
jgi:F0F1-type ATP synthase assembly protein I